MDTRSVGIQLSQGVGFDQLSSVDLLDLQTDKKYKFISIIDGLYGTECS